MSGFYRDPEIAATIRDIQTQLAAVQRQTQQFKVPLARVTRTTAQSITTGSPTAIVFDTEGYDTANAWTAALPDRFTIPLAGVYHIGATMQFFPNATGGREGYFSTTGGPSFTLSGLGAPGSATFGNYMSFGSILAFAVGDIIQVTAWQNSGGNLDIVIGATMTLTWLGVA